MPDQGFHPGFACDRSGACASTCAATTSKTPKEYAERRRDCEKVQYVEAIPPRRQRLQQSGSLRSCAPCS